VIGKGASVFGDLHEADNNSTKLFAYDLDPKNQGRNKTKKPFSSMEARVPELMANHFTKVTQRCPLQPQDDLHLDDLFVAFQDLYRKFFVWREAHPDHPRRYFFPFAGSFHAL